jgi:glycosyltransferase involved in cell wall biosynthesis
MPRVAHFLQNPNLLGSPPNDALVAAYQSLGYAVDLYSTWGGEVAHPPQPGVCLLPIEYTGRWLLRNAARPSWRRYSLFSATTEDPLAAAGVLARLWRRPLVTLADEIRSGSYSGIRGTRWKNLCRWGMRQSRLTIVNEEERIALQRDYAGMAPDNVMQVYPGCFRSPPAPGDRAALRATRGLPADALVICYSGMMSHGNGGLWIAEILRRCPSVWVWGQIVNLDPLSRGLLDQVQGRERLVLEPERLSWQEAWSSMAAADIGLVAYLQDAPQYRHMGIASNRLCMFLAMGVPVIASRQPSFEFIERYDCGVLIDNEQEVALAVDRITARLDLMRGNARRCAAEYIRAPQRWIELRDRISAAIAR